MKKLKTQKGITLIALIITIVVLLIIAVVAIGAAQDSNIVGYAQNAAGKYEEGKGLEDNAIAGYENMLNKYANGGNSVGGSSVPNNGGTTNNPSEGNNGNNPEVGPEQSEPTPTPEITPEPTPTPVTYYSKTLNTNMNDYADALSLRQASIINYSRKITYISGENKLTVTLENGTTVADFAVVYVKYTNAQGSVSKYAICDSDYAWTLERCEAYQSTAYPYIPGNVWSKPSGKKYTNTGGFSSEEYEPITQIPVFEGEWQIDEANTTAEGKQYLSNVLIDVTN